VRRDDLPRRLELHGRWTLQRALRAAAPLATLTGRTNDRIRKHPFPRLVDTTGWMPTVLRSGPYRIYFLSHEPNEPPHVHVDRDNSSAKFWLSPVSLVRTVGYSRRELAVLEGLIQRNELLLLEAWYDFFGI
jgi:hypothetical protein